jgi:hypothetical protein
VLWARVRTARGADAAAGRPAREADRASPVAKGSRARTRIAAGGSAHAFALVDPIAPCDGPRSPRRSGHEPRSRGVRRGRAPASGTSRRRLADAASDSARGDARRSGHAGRGPRDAHGLSLRGRRRGRDRGRAPEVGGGRSDEPLPRGTAVHRHARRTTLRPEGEGRRTPRPNDRRGAARHRRAHPRGGHRDRARRLRPRHGLRAALRAPRQGSL